MKYSVLLLWLVCLFGLSGYAQNCSFTFSPNVPRCPGTQITFEADTLPFSSLATYAWNYGDGTSGSGPITRHAYPFNNAAQTYTVQLTVTDTGNVSCQVTQTISVLYQPQIDFCGGIAPNLCIPNVPCNQPITIPSLSFCTSPGSSIPISIDFGDGSPNVNSTAGANLSHTYNQFGVYPITITANGSSCPSRLSQPINYYTTPASPDIILPIANKCEGEPITATVRAQNPCPDNILYYVIYWDYIGDRSLVDTLFTSNIDSISFTYDFPNISSFTTNYNAEITVFPVNPCFPDDKSLNPSYKSTGFNIRVAPTPDFTMIPNPACWPDDSVISFTNRSTPAPVFPANYLDFFWDFGDPTTAQDTTSLANPGTYTYPGPGIYPVSLTAIDSICGPATLIQDLIITEDAQAAFTASQTSGCAPLAVTFNNTSTPPNSPEVNVRYRWEVMGGRGFGT